jgi:hypothetical protein
VWVLRKVLNPLSPTESMELPIDKLSKTASSSQFLAAMQGYFLSRKGRDNAFGLCVKPSSLQ